MKEPIIVVGAGWAGLASALTLTTAGHPVIVLEAAPNPGGRARKVSFGDHTVDNGQHLFIGAYQHTLSLLKTLEIPECSVFNRLPLNLCMRDPTQQKPICQLKFPKFLAPFHALIGLLNSDGFSLKERFQLSQFFRKLQKLNFQLQKDISIEALLKRYHQSDRLITNIWSPLALATLSTPITEGSAQVFLHVLRTAFTLQTDYSDFLFPTTDLSQIFPDPAVKYLVEKQNKVLYHQRAIELCFEKQRCVGVKTKSQYFEGRSIILATPPSVTAQILRSNSETSTHCHSLIQTLDRFQYQPITTVYLQYENPIKFSLPMVGLINSCGHWIFDRGLSGQPHILSVVITGHLEHPKEDQDSFITTLSREIQALYPQLGMPIASRLITEKRAAFTCEVGIEDWRPDNPTPIDNLWIAGDYTQTGYPATLEGAVLSGKKAAERVLLKYPFRFCSD